MERKISFTGDIICNKTILEKHSNEKGEYDFDRVFEGLKALFSESDLVVGNLETPIAGEKLGYTSRSFSFNSPIEFAKAVKNMGVGFVSIANNHLNDRGVAGIIRTCKNLRKIGLPYSGARLSRREHHGVIVDVGGLRIGMLCYTAFTNSILFSPYRVNYLQDRKKNFLVRFYIKKKIQLCKTFVKSIITGKRVEIVRKSTSVPGGVHGADMSSDRYNTKERKLQIGKEIARLRNLGADLIVMNAHMGGQFSSAPDKPVVDYAEWLLEQGVNALVINHEHIVQEADFSKLNDRNQVVAYCLGNFLATSGVCALPYGRLVEYSVVFHMYVDEETKRIRCAFSPVKIILDAEEKFKVLPVYDLIGQCEDETEKAKLIEDNLAVYNMFMKTNRMNLDVMREYPCEQ